MKIARRLRNWANFWRSRPLLVAIVLWYSAMWSWVYVTDSLELAGGRIPGLIMATLVLMVNVSISATVIWQAFAYLDRLIKRYKTRLVLVLALPLLALADLLVSWLVAVIWIGPQGSIDNTLPMGSPGLPLMTTPFKFAARLLGLYGLSGTVWLVIWLLRQKEAVKAGIVLITLAIVSFIGWLAYGQPNGQELSATIVSETIEKRVPQIPSKSDLVIFPEYGLDLVDNTNRQTRLAITKPGQSKTYFVGSEQKTRAAIPVHQNVLMFGDSTDGITFRQEKKRLIPGGEDLAYAARFLLRTTGQLGTLDYFSTQKSIAKGQDKLRPLELGGKGTLGLGLCSSIIAPHDYRRLTRQGSTVLANSASLFIFQGSSIFGWQQKNLAKFNAVANARYFLQSANSASAYALDSNGHQYAEVNNHQSANVMARNSTKLTIYTLLGEWLVILGGLMAIGLTVDRRRQQC